MWEEVNARDKGLWEILWKKTRKMNRVERKAQFYVWENDKYLGTLRRDKCSTLRADRKKILQKQNAFETKDGYF